MRYLGTTTFILSLLSFTVGYILSTTYPLNSKIASYKQLRQDPVRSALLRQVHVLNSRGDTQGAKVVMEHVMSISPVSNNKECEFYRKLAILNRWPGISRNRAGSPHNERTPVVPKACWAQISR